MTKLTYSDYRPIRDGDKGYSPEKARARWYYSPSRQESISYRQFVTFARGESYEKHAKKQKALGIEKKKYKPRKAKVREPPGKHLEPPKPEKKKIGLAERADFLKESFARRYSQHVGKEIDFSQLSDKQKTNFWNLYHDLVDRQTAPSERIYEEEYENFFDLEYDMAAEIYYGTTP